MPLIIKQPVTGGSRRAARVVRRVSTERLAATVLDLSGVRSSGVHQLASSFGTIAERGDEGAAEEGVFNSSVYYFEDRIAVVFDGFKYIRWLASGFEELYDLTVDSGERVSVAATASERVEAARQLVRRYSAEQAATAAAVGVEASRHGEGDEAFEERLRALGYLP